MPDYYTFDTALFSDDFIGEGFAVTVTRNGKLYIGPQVGFGTEGWSSMLRAGWIGGPWSRAPSPTVTNNFVQGNSFTLSGQAGAGSLPGGAGLDLLYGGAETWGNPRNPLHMFGSGTHDDWATEAGTGDGSSGVSLTWSYSWNVSTALNW